MLPELAAGHVQVGVDWKLQVAFVADHNATPCAEVSVAALYVYGLREVAADEGVPYTTRLAARALLDGQTRDVFVHPTEDAL